VGTITFSGSVSPAPMTVLIMPANAATADSLASLYTTVPSTSSWTLAVSLTGLTATVQYAWYYFVF